MVIFAAKYRQINLRVNVIIISMAIFLLANHVFAQRKQVELRYLPVAGKHDHTIP
jgi:hypothetical protein